MTFILLYWKYLAAAALIGLLTIAYNVHVDGLIKVEVTKAVLERDASWRDSEAKAIAKSRADAQVVEEAQQMAIAAINAQHQKEITDGKAQSARDVAAARSGALRLRIPAPSCSSTADVSGAAGGGNPSAATEALPSGLTERLLGLANAADDNIDALNSCWQIVASDRKISTPKGAP